MRSALIVTHILAVLALCGCASMPNISRYEGENRDAVLLHLERGDVDKAIWIAKHITHPTTLIGMRVDRRFTTVVQALPNQFEKHYIESALVDEERGKMNADPRSLQRRYVYALELIRAMRLEEALALTQSTIDSITAAKDKNAPFTDLNKSWVWLLDVHARALARNKRAEEAAEVLKVASDLRENGQSNVSQRINLALLAAKLGRTQEANESISKVDAVSDYGLTQILLAKLIVAEQVGDRAASERLIGELRSHQGTSLNTYLLGLLEANMLDEAASLTIDRLRDPKKRFDALVEVQDYPEYYSAYSASIPRAALRIERWRSVTQRPDVRAEILKVGKIESFKVEGPN